MKTDLLNRRLRFAPPNPLVRSIVVNKADLLIFEAINRHGPLPINYLYEFQKHVRKNYTNFQKRLTEFYNGDSEKPFLVRPPRQFAGFEARYQHIVYDLAPRARQLLAERCTLGRYSPKRADPFLHQLMGACVGASLELTAKGKGLRYISREEILNHPKCGEAKDAKNPMAIPLRGLDQSRLIPDDLFGLEYPGVGFRFFAVEIDRNTESIERRNLDHNTLGKKIFGYLDILCSRTHQKWWGVPNLHILIVTVNTTHARNILNYIDGLNEQKHAARFAIQCETSFGPNWRVPKTLLAPLVTEPWVTINGKKDFSQV